MNKVCILQLSADYSRCCVTDQDTALGKPREVFRLAEDLSKVEDRVCPSLSLTSATWAALSDGCGRLYLLRTGKRGDSTYMKWEASYCSRKSSISKV